MWAKCKNLIIVKICSSLPLLIFKEEKKHSFPEEYVKVKLNMLNFSMIILKYVSKDIIPSHWSTIFYFEVAV